MKKEKELGKFFWILSNKLELKKKNDIEQLKQFKLKKNNEIRRSFNEKQKQKSLKLIKYQQDIKIENIQPNINQNIKQENQEVKYIIFCK